MKYRKNSVKGQQRGKKYSEAVRTACMCDLLVMDNLSDVAKKHGVPESTLRTWERQARRKTPGEQKSLFEAAREQELRELNRKASAAANNSVISARMRSTLIKREGSLTRGAISRLPRKRATSPAPSSKPMVSGESPAPLSQTLQKGRKIP